MSTLAFQPISSMDPRFSDVIQKSCGINGLQAVRPVAERAKTLFNTSITFLGRQSVSGERGLMPVFLVEGSASKVEEVREKLLKNLQRVDLYEIHWVPESPSDVLFYLESLRIPFWGEAVPD